MKKYIWVIVLAVLALFTMIISFLGVIDKQLGIVFSLILILIFNILGALAARKEKVKVLFYLFIVFTIISFILVILNIVTLVKSRSNIQSFDFQITVTDGKEEKKELFEYDNTSFYTYKIKEVNVVIKGGEKYSLQNALESNKVTLDEIKSAMISDKKQSGYTIYRDGGTENISNSSYSIVFCDDNAKKGDIIIVPFDYKYEKEICS